MKVEDIKTIADMQRYCEGCINDFEAGVSTKEETMKAFEEYTFHLIELTANKVSKSEDVKD